MSGRGLGLGLGLLDRGRSDAPLTPFRNLVSALLHHEQIKTTLPKAKEAARMAEKVGAAVSYREHFEHESKCLENGSLRSDADVHADAADHHSREEGE